MINYIAFILKVTIGFISLPRHDPNRSKTMWQQVQPLWNGSAFQGNLPGRRVTVDNTQDQTLKMKS